MSDIKVSESAGLSGGSVYRDMSDMSSSRDKIAAAFSPCGADPSPAVAYYAVYEFGQKATNITYNWAVPLIVAALGDDLYANDDRGKIIWGYTAGATSCSTALLFLCFTPILEFGLLKRRVVTRAQACASLCLVCLVLCGVQFFSKMPGLKSTADWCGWQ